VKKEQQLNKRKFSWWRCILTGIVASAGVGLIVFVGFMLYLDAQVLARFSSEDKWQVPGKVYARALELYAGANLDRQMLEHELELLRYERKGTAQGLAEDLKAGTYSLINRQTVAFTTRGFKFWDGLEPVQEVVAHFENNRLVRLTDPKRQSLPIVRLEPALIGGFFPGHREDRLLITLDDTPLKLIDVLLLVEDRKFYSHSGVSFRAITRAFIANVRQGRVTQGGSTLTQQLVKNYFLHSERTVSRKVKEVLMSFLLEFHFSKETLLQAYLNEVYLGQAGSRAIHGFGLGSYHYFGQPLEALSIDQMALLVGLVRGPSHYDPRRYPYRARARRNQILRLMSEAGMVTEIELDQLSRRPLGVLAKTRNAVNQYPAFTDLVRRQLERDYPDHVLNSEGLMIYTTLDPYVQSWVEKAVTDGMPKLITKGRTEAKDMQAAAIFSAPQSGEVLALVGSSPVKVAGFNRALDAKRPVGSIIKPFVYLASLQQSDYLLNTPVSDETYTLKQPNGQIWEPKNFDELSHGDVILQEALVHSYNQATARLAMSIGIEKTVHVLDVMGLKQRVKPLPALALGALELAPIEVLQLYQTLAAEGFNTPLRSIRAVVKPDGTLVQRYPYDVKQVVPSSATFEIKHALRTVVERGTAKSIRHHWSQMPVLAGKTGTTDDLRDSWFVGMAENYLGVVWVGRDQNGPTGLTGAQGALQLWAEVMVELPVRGLRLPLPEEYAYAWVHPNTGVVIGPSCPLAVRVAMPSDQLPQWPSGCDGYKESTPDVPRSSPLRRFWPF